jgi:hypothetical protein
VILCSNLDFSLIRVCYDSNALNQSKFGKIVYTDFGKYHTNFPFTSNI